MSDEQDKEITDIKQLEIQIENLRCAIIALIIVASLLVGYVIIQSIQQFSFSYFASFGLFVVIAFAILLICAYSFATAKD